MNIKVCGVFGVFFNIGVLFIKRGVIVDESSSLQAISTTEQWLKEPRKLALPENMERVTALP